MKNVTLKFKPLVFFLLIGFAFSSCNSDDDAAAEEATLDQVDLIEVANGATDVALQPSFSWSAATDPNGGEVSYDLYLDTVNPPATKIASNISERTYVPQDNLDFETDYYWIVIAKDSEGNTTESDIASFTSRAKTAAELISGRWYYESIEGESALSACSKKSYYQFKGDWAVVKVFEDGFKGVCEEKSDSGIAGNFKINSSQIEITPKGGKTATWKIGSLTETELVLRLGKKLLTLKKE